MNLLIDIGNSSVKAAFAKGVELGITHRYFGENLLGFIKGVMSGNRPDIIAISSVRKIDDYLSDTLRMMCGKLIIVGFETELPIKNGYSTPETLGSDRLLAAVGAFELFKGRECLIFDFGTALTIDRLDANGVFCGGNISLGLNIRIKALHEYTQRLPLIEIPKKVVTVGGSTKEAIESGIILGMVYEIEGYINRYPDCIFVFTGGDAIYFAEKMKRSIFVVYNLVLMGLAHVAHYHAKT